MADDRYAWINEIPDEEITVAHYRALVEQIWVNDATEADREFIDKVVSILHEELDREGVTAPIDDHDDQAGWWWGWDLGTRMLFLHAQDDCHDEETHDHMMEHLLRGARFSCMVLMRLFDDLPDHAS